jgi:hypothetical protein
MRRYVVRQKLVDVLLTFSESESKPREGRAVAQAVGDRLPTAAAQVRSQVR